MRIRHLACAASIAGLVIACTSGSDGTPSASSSSGGSSSGVASSSSGGSSSGATRTSSGGSSSGGSSGSGGASQLQFTAKHDGAAPPNGTKVVVLWSVFSGSPDYLYSYGTGQTTGIDVFVTLGGPPPADALNGGKLGIGLVASLNDGADLPEGKLINDWKTLVRAITPMHAVVYRAATEQLTSKGWDLAFPQGYACGKCIDAEAGFDTFEVEDCANMQLLPMSDTLKFCNFT